MKTMQKIENESNAWFLKVRRELEACDSCDKDTLLLIQKHTWMSKRYAV